MLLQHDLLLFTRINGCDHVVLFLVKRHRLHIVKDAKQVSLDGVRVTGLTQDLQQGRVADKEKAWEHQPLLLQIPKQVKKVEFENVFGI